VKTFASSSGALPKNTGVQDLLDRVKEAVPSALRHAHVRWWFRGQSKSEWSLHHAVYRSGFPANNEADRLNVEQHLTQDFRILRWF
jgi:hypothetical protein